MPWNRHGPLDEGNPRDEGLLPLHGKSDGDAMRIASDVGLLTGHIRPVCMRDIFTLPRTILVDPARGHCYRSPTKPCESWGGHTFGYDHTGGRLSNTWTTCPREGDNPGKLGLIPHREWVLECPISESLRAPEDGSAAD